MKKISEIVDIDKVNIGLQISMIQEPEEVTEQFNSAKEIVDLIISDCGNDDALRGAIIATKMITDIIMSTITQADEHGLIDEKVVAIYNFATTYIPIISLGIITSDEVFNAVKREKEGL